MRILRHLTRGIRTLVRGGAADRELDEEIEQFIDEASSDLEAQGMPPAEARRVARARAGSPLAAREEVRAAGWEHAIETLIADVRYGLRGLRRRPGFAAVTIGTLGLGIGASTAMVSVANPILFDRLPYPAADRLHMIWDRTRDGSTIEMAFGSFLELEARSRSFSGMAVMRSWQPTLTGATEPERLDGQGVSDGYFRVLGIAPAIGRDFEPADDRPNAPAVVIVSHRLWQRRLDSDTAIVGRQIVLDGNSYTVIGVMPPRFENVLMPAAEVWRAAQYDRTLPALQGREWGHNLRLVARRADGVNAAAAAAELDQIARDRMTGFSRPPWAAMQNGLLLPSLHDEITSNIRSAMLAVLVAVTLLLAIACVNVANLILGRGAERRAEFVMRSALGAGRLRLFRQLLTEAVLIALLGGMAGLAVAGAGVRLLVSFVPEALMPATPIAIDGPVFAFALAVTMVIGLAVGLAPAVHASRTDLKANTPHGSWQTSSSHHRTRRSLVTAEVAFALVLLVGATLLSRSLQQLFAISPGFNGDNLLTMQVQVAGRRFTDPQVTQQFFQRALDAVRAVPGVSEAALSSQLPLSGDSDIYGVRFESSETPETSADGGAYRYAISEGFFDVMGIPLLAGRAITAHDRAGSTPVVVINESFAKRRFPGRDPIGQRLHLGPVDREWFTIAGVVGDIKQESLSAGRFDAAYISPSQWHFADPAFWLVVKTRATAATVAPSIRQAVWSVDKDQPIVRVAMMSDLITATAGQRRFALLLFQLFGITALLLTAIGIYGVVSGGVNERIREIGVRTALGASRRSILSMVLKQGVALAAIGIALGAIVAAASSRGLSALLFGISPLDPVSYAAVAMLLMGVTIAACWWPARRAARVDPSLTLRAE